PAPYADRRMSATALYRASTTLHSCSRRAARTTNAYDSNAAGMVALPRSSPIRHLPRFHDRGSATAQPAAGNDPSWQRGLDLGADLLAADGHGELGPRRGQLRHRALRPVPITARDQPRRLDSGIDAAQLTGQRRETGGDQTEDHDNGAHSQRRFHRYRATLAFPVS